MASGGDMRAAAELMDSAERSAETGQAKRELARIAPGFRAGIEFREWIASFVRWGRTASLYVDFAGSRVRAELTGADDSGVRARLAENELALGWEKIEPARARALDDFALAFGLKE